MYPLKFKEKVKKTVSQKIYIIDFFTPLGNSFFNEISNPFSN